MIPVRLLLGISGRVLMHLIRCTASIIRMDQAVPVIPTFGTYFGYARPQRGETRFVLKIWMAWIAGMIHLGPASPLIRLVGTSGRLRG